MEKKFKETSISEEYSKALANQHLLIGPTHVYKIATVLFHGASMCLSAMKNTSVGKALIFRAVDGRFLAGAKVQYIANVDDPNNPAAGRWDYTWTAYEEDLKDCDTVDVANNAMIAPYFTAAGISLYNMNTLVEFIINWLKENVTDTEPATLVLNGVFKGVAEVDPDGSIDIGIIPDGAMKVLIKDDSAIQDAA